MSIPSEKKNMNVIPAKAGIQNNNRSRNKFGMTGGVLKIGEAAKVLGVSIDTLRRWEKKGKISTIRTPGGTRLYSVRQLKRITPDYPSSASEKFNSSQTPSSNTKPVPTSELIKSFNPDITIGERTKALDSLVSGSPPKPSGASNPVIASEAWQSTHPFSEGQNKIASSFSTPRNDKPFSLFTIIIKRAVTISMVGSAFAGVIIGSLLLAYLINPISTTQLVHGLASTSSAILTEMHQNDNRELTGDQIAAINSNLHSTAVLAATTSAHYLEINSDVYIQGQLGVRDTINGVALESTGAAGFSIATANGSATLNVTNSSTIDQNLSTSSSPTWSTLNLSAAKNQLVFANSSVINFQTTGTRTIIIPDVSDTLVTLAATQTLTNKTINSSIIDSTPIGQNTPEKGTFTNLKATSDTILQGALSVTGATTLSSSVNISGTAQFSGVVQLSDGTASSPSLTFSSDTNTGLYRLATDKIGLITGGIATQGITIDASGNVGIGTITPTFTLDVTGTERITSNSIIGGTLAVTGATTLSSTLAVSGASTLSSTLNVSGNTTLASDLTVDTNTFYVNSTLNRVGIGTTSPQAPLHVIGDGTNAAFFLTGNVGIGTTAARASLDVHGLANNSASLNLFGTGPQISIGNGTDTATTLDLEFPDLTTANASLRLFRSTNTSGTKALEIYKGDNSASIQTYFNTYGNSYINALSGNLGIATASTPGTTLAIAGNVNIGSAYADKAGPANGLSVQGNLGIGTTSPTTALYVNGRTTITNNIMVENGHSVDIASSTQRVATGYFDTIDAFNLAGVVTGGSTTSNSWTINSDNATADTEDMALTFERGTLTPNASLGWNSGTASPANVFTLNSGLYSTGTINGNAGISLGSYTYSLISPSGQNLTIYPGGTGGSGNLGIGTTGPIAYVNIAGRGSSTGLTFLTQNSTQSNWGLAVLDNGNVGIGTSNPINPLDVTTYTDNTGILSSYYGTGSNSPYIATARARGNVTSPSAVLNGDLIGKFSMLGYDSTGFRTSTAIQGFADGNWSGSARGGYLTFSVTPNGGTILSEAMRITSGGNIGIGTASPTDKLIVSGGNVGIGITTPITALAVNGAGTIGWGVTGVSGPTNGLAVSGNVGIGTQSPQASLYVTGNTMIGYASGAPASLANGLAVSGNVGIGTTNPVKKLDVRGAMVVEGGTLTIGEQDVTNGYFINANSSTQLEIASVGGRGLILQSGGWNAGQSFGKIDLGNSGSSGRNLIFSTSTGSGGTGFSERMRITDTGSIGIGYNSIPGATLAVNGNVGIGTSSAGAALQVNGAGLFGWGAAPGVAPSNGLAVFGNVGIGTTGPSTNFDIEATNTTGNVGTVNANSLTSGTAFNISSTSTALSTGGLLNLNWTPGTATTMTGDLFNIGVGVSGTIGNFLNIQNAGSSVFSVSQSAFTTSLPVNFTSPGDVGIAYDLNFTNPTASFIKSASNLYVQAGETFNSSTLTLQTFNSGQIVLDAAGGVTLNQAQNWTLPASTINALNFQNSAGTSLFDLDSTNLRVGIGTSAPVNKLDVAGAQVIGAGYAGIYTAPTNGLLVQGNVGIGTSNGNPAYNLSVAGTTNITGALSVGSLTNSGTFLAPNGSASLPSYSFSNLTNAGLWTNGDGLLLTTGGSNTKGITVTGAGNVGIGTTSPSAKLYVSGSSNQILQTAGTIIGNANEQDIALVGGSLTGTNSYSSIGRGFQGLNISTNLGQTSGATITNYNGVFVLPQLSTTSADVSNVTNLSGLQVYSGYGYSGNNSTVTNARGLWLRGWGAILPGGSFTNNYGIYMDAISGASNNYGLYFANNPNGGSIASAASTNISIMPGSGGNVGINTVSPLGKLNIAGVGVSTGFSLLTQGTGSTATFGLAVLDNGNVGIGTTGPAGLFEVGSSATNPSLFVSSSNGNVGIGTSVPSYALDLEKTSSSTNLTAANINLASGYTGSSSTNGLYIINSAAGTDSSCNACGNAGIQVATNGNGAGNNLGMIISAQDAAHTTGLLSFAWAPNRSAASVIGVYSGATIGDDKAVAGYFRLNNSAPPTITNSAALVADNGTATADIFEGKSNGTTKFTIDTNGNVGIGFTSPDRTLQIASDINISPSSILSANGSQLSLTGSSGTGLNKKLTLGIDTTDNYGVIQAGNTDGTTYNLSLQATGGNVGIGTSSPAYKLDVNGIVNATALYVNGSAYIGSQWTTTGNDIFYKTGNVGIGTSVQDRTLQVAADLTVNTANLLATNGTQFAITGNSASGLNDKLVLGIDTTNQYGVIQAGSTLGTNFNLNLNPNGGNVGIGTTTPAANLDIAGVGPTFRMTDTTAVSAKSLLVNVKNNIADFRAPTLPAGSVLSLDLSNSRVGIGTSSPTQTLQVGTGANQLSFDTTNNRLGIGTSSPAYTIDVVTSGTRVLALDGNGRLNLNLTAVSAGLGIGSSASTSLVTINASNSSAERTGAARRTYTDTLVPEYPGGVLTADGTNNVGTMTSDFCSKTAGSVPDTNTTFCTTAGDKHNYYSWTANATNDYDVWTRWQVPSDFDDTGSDGLQSIAFDGWRTSASDSVTLNVYKADGTSCGTATAISGTVATWNHTTYTLGSCTVAAGDVLNLRAQLSVGVSSEYALMGEIAISYKSKFK